MADRHRIPITIADVLIDLASPLSAAELGIEQRLGPFCRPSDAVRARVALEWLESDGPPIPRGECFYDPGSIWKMHRDAEGYCAAFSYPSTAAERQIQGVLCTNPEWDRLTLTEHRSGPQWCSLLNVGAGELLLRTAIIFTGGLVFHAAGIDDNGRGLVFIGHSGAGKSTQVGLWDQEPGVVPMNDDRIAVRAGTGLDIGALEAPPLCYGTPWGGTANIARNHTVPLTALILLEQAPVNDIQLISPTAAASLLMARTFLPYWDRALMQRAMSNLSAILAQVPVYRLRCRPERAIIPLVRSALCSSPTAN